MNPSLNGPAPAEDQAKLLDEALNVVKLQAHHMRKCLDNNKLMDGLKHCSTMLAELRTSALTPKNYYELYMAIFDALRHLTIYLIEAHTAGRHHLADLYELVQYAGNIVPRLYLMITVGAAYMSIKDAPVREIMRDMMEMSRGVQHPTRGLFLRHYLSGMTRDYLPIGDGEGPEGNLSESIKFILTNFTEMNKLWVRLQHQGHSRDREKREAERRELKILVGTNLVRLSQLEGVDLDIYKRTIMPGVLDQVVSCRDVIAQEYLMEVIIQVFPDEYHLRSLEPFLTATAQLHPKLNVKSIIIALIDRLAAFAAREAESESTDKTKSKLLTLTAEEKQKRKAKSEAQAENADAEEEPVEEEGKENKKADEDDETAMPNSNGEEKTADADVGKEDEDGSSIKKYRGIPEDVELFVVFWTQIVELVKARPDLTVQDLTALLVSLTNLSLSCYPEKINYVNQVLTYAKDKVIEYSDTPDLHSKITESNLLALLLAPITSYPTVLTLLLLDSYQPLLALQTYSTRKSVAHAIISSVLRNETIISEPEDVIGVLDMCDVLIRDQKDAPVVTTAQSPAYGSLRNRKTEFASPEQEELAEEQGWLARMIHLLRSDDEDKQFLLLSAARKQLSEGGERIRYTFPPLTSSAIQLARRYKLQDNQDEQWEKKIAALFRFIHQVIALLESKTESSDMCLRLYLLAGQSADECGFEDVAYEFFVQAFTIYEDSICDSRAQYQAITCIVGTLQTTRVFSFDNYDTLITKAALHGSKLLKKADQCRAVYMSSHLWWATERFNESESEEKELFRDGQRVLNALKIADSTLNAVTNVELFVEILNRYIYYFEQRNEAVTVKYLNGLIDLINTNLANMDNPDQHPRSSSSSSLIEFEGPVSEYVSRHFKSTLLHLQNRAEVARAKVAHDSSYEGARYDQVDLGDI
ncbi:unnamed protein product [Umbelopsis vinacea]